MTTDPNKKPRYTLAELLAQCDPNAPALPILAEWDRLPPVGLERLIEDEIETARQWREERGYCDRGGVVVVWNGDVQGWVNVLGNPEHWQPGCVAVDEHGKSWTVTAGNVEGGTLSWLANESLY